MLETDSAPERHKRFFTPSLLGHIAIGTGFVELTYGMINNAPTEAGILPLIAIAAGCAIEFATSKPHDELAKSDASSCLNETDLVE